MLDPENEDPYYLQFQSFSKCNAFKDLFHKF